MIWKEDLFYIVANSDANVYDDDNVEKYIQDELISLSEDRIISFSKKISESVDRIKQIVEGAKKEEKTVAAWGAGQRGCTLIGMCSFTSDDLKYVIDVNKNYWNKYVPGTDIRILPPEAYQDSHVNKIIIFSTGYADSIIAENKKFLDAGGEFIKIV